jgi:hypothetical protein
MTFRKQQVAFTEANNGIFTNCTAQEGFCYDSCSKSSQYLSEIRIVLASERGLLSMEVLDISQFVTCNIEFSTCIYMCILLLFLREL